MKQTSIRKRLLASILSVVLVSTLFIIVLTYYGLQDEMNELFDENMKQVAKAVQGQGFTDTPVAVTQDGRAVLKGEEEFLIQIWKGNNLSYSSLPALHFPRQGEIGMHTVQFQDKSWRYYLLQDGVWTMQVSQPLPTRYSVITEIYAALLPPIIIQLPIVAGFIWFFLGYGFRPLARISDLIQKRTPAYLEKITAENVPIEISTLVAALNDLLSRLQQALETQRQFTADAAHELRTPLTAVRLQLDILQRAQNPKDHEEALGNLFEGVARSTRLVEQLLQLARQEPEAIAIKMAPVDMGTIIEGVHDQFLALAQAKGLSIIITKNGGSDFTVTGEENSLCILVANLLSNAINYPDPGGTVRISLSTHGEHIILDVADSGRGIPLAEQSRIFDRFYRISGSDTLGSGLGLSIVRSIADCHHAKITLQEGLNDKGVCFRVLFNSKLPADLSS